MQEDKAPPAEELSSRAGNIWLNSLLANTDASTPVNAVDYVENDTEEFYWLSYEQVTIPRRAVRDDRGEVTGFTYEGVLNEAGKRLYDATLKRVVDGLFTATVRLDRLDYSNSGPWYPDTKSKWYKDDGPKGFFNSHDNYRVTGTRLKQDGSEEPICTSVMIFYDTAKPPTWALTKSGSLYKLV